MRFKSINETNRNPNNIWFHRVLYLLFSLHCTNNNAGIPVLDRCFSFAVYKRILPGKQRIDFHFIFRIDPQFWFIIFERQTIIFM